MKRRDVLKYAAYASGAAVSSPFFSAFLSKAATKYLNLDAFYKPLFFAEQEFMMLREIADSILPKTESPSASDVGVPATIDAILANVYRKEDQQTFKKSFASLEIYLKSKKFLDSNTKQKVAILTKLDKSDDSNRWTYLDIKQQVITYYLNSEEIGENYLNYIPVPGYYDPCITIESVNGKAWAI